MSKIYTDEFLISELHRFKRENGRVPTQLDMTAKNGYPSVQAYVNHFGSFNKSLNIANLLLNEIHHKLDGTETCSYCGKRADEVVGHIGWYYHNDKPYCYKHGNSEKGGSPDYVKGQLDINSAKGLGRAGEILVAKVLKIPNEHDYNRESCDASIDLYHEEYKKIDVKTSLLSNNERSRWKFGFNAKKEADTYICIGLSSDRKDVKHVWIVPNIGRVRYSNSLSVENKYRSLYNRNHWEVNVEPYNNMWKSMSLDNCKIMIDKNKEETEEEKLKFEKFKKEYFKRLGIEE